MKKIIFLIFFLLISSIANAFLVQDRCDEEKSFSVSSRAVCEKLCPNRKTFLGYGSNYDSYECIRKDQKEPLEEKVDKPLCYFYLNDEVEAERLTLECLKAAVENQQDNIYIGRSSEAKDLCEKTAGYTIKEEVSGEDYCIKSCPKDYPLMGYEGDCYPCNTEFEIMMDSFIYAVEEEIVNVCPNDRIIRGNYSVKIKK